MASGQQVTFEPTLAHVLTEHFHDLTAITDMLIGFKVFGNKHAVCDFRIAPKRFDAVSSGPITLKFTRFFSVTSRKNVPMTRVASASFIPGFSTGTA